MQVLRQALSVSKHRMLPPPSALALNKAAQDGWYLKYIFRGCKNDASDNAQNSAQGSGDRSSEEASHEQQEVKTQSDSSDNATFEEPPVDERENKIQQLEVERDELMDRLKRSLADMENLRERARREQESTHKYAVGSFAKELLDVADNLRRALSTTEVGGKGEDSDSSATASAAFKSLFEGVKITENQLQGVFAKHGVKPIVAKLGDPFDHNLHQALFEVKDAGKESGTIAHIAKDGYTIHDRVLRPAEVGVVKNEGS